MKPFAQYRNNGTLWRAGRGIWGLCSAYNHATNPAAFMTDEEHQRSCVYARAILGRLQRLGAVYGVHYRETSNGSLWPLKTIAE